MNWIRFPRSVGRTPPAALAITLMVLACLVPVRVRAQQSPEDSAATLLEAGMRAYRQGSRDSVEQSIRLFQQAVGQLHTLNERRAEGNTLRVIAMAHNLLGRADSALGYDRRALAIQREVGDRGGEGSTLNSLGENYLALGRADSALAFSAQALVIQRQVRDRRGEGVTLTNIGAAHQSLGRADSALGYYAQALPIRRQVGDRIGEGTTLNNIGSAYRLLGRYDSALVYLSRALSISRAVGNRRGEVSTLNNLGSVHQALGRADSAVFYLAQALSIVRELGNHLGEATTLSNLAMVHEAMGRTDSALVYYARALPILREVGDRRGEGSVLNNLGLIHEALGRADSALLYLAQALSIHRDVGDRISEGATLNGIGSTYQHLGRADSALVYLARALSIAREVRDRSGEGIMVSNVGSVYETLGKVDSALVYYARALPIHREVGNRRGEGTTLNNIGMAYFNLGRADSALIYYARALSAAREVGNLRNEGALLNNIGVIFTTVGRADSALTYFARALPIHREIGNRRGEGTTLGNIGSVYQDLGRGDSALVYLGRALSIRREVGDRIGEGVTLSNIGTAHTSLFRADSALFYLAQSLPIQRDVGDRSAEGTTLSEIGSAYRALGRVDSALVYYGRALAIAREVGDRRGEADRLNNIGLVYHGSHSLRDLTRAVAYYDSAAVAVGELGRFAGRDPNRLSFAEKSVPLFQEWPLAWLARAPEVGEPSAASAALAASERGRAQALRELIRGNSTETRGAAGAIAAHPGPGADLPAEGRTLALALARQGVPSLSYVVTRDTLLAFLILPGREVEVFRTPVRADTLTALVARVRAGLGVETPASRAPADDWETQITPTRRAEVGNADRWRDPATRLATLLLPAELRARLPASGELLIVPSGALNLLPFAALPLSPDAVRGSDSSFLGLRYAIRYAPSLQLLADLEAQPSHSLPTAQPLVVGNPTMPRVLTRAGALGQLAPLPGAEAEGHWVASRLRTRVLTGDRATEAAVRARLVTATLVHLATHGYAYAGDARSRDSFVALAPGDGEDGLLTVGEVLDGVARMRAELVVLSACQTGLGNLKQAEGTVGLQRAFLARGARGVLVTLWSVDDEATELLMQRFYTHWLAGATKAEALRQAQEEVAANSRFAHPRSWAAYQMVGAR